MSTSMWSMVNFTVLYLLHVFDLTAVSGESRQKFLTIFVWKTRMMGLAGPETGY